jgi:uncharacterized membrane protein YccC
VVFVIGNSFGETVTRARHRTLGTAAGVLLGLVTAGLLRGDPWTLAGLCILAQMLGALVAQRRYDIASAAVGFSVVIGLHLIAGLGPEDMLARVYETAIGAGVALLVSRLVVPVYGGDEARRQITAILARCRAAFAAWWPGGQASSGEPAMALVRDLVQLEERLPYLNAEAVLGQRPAGEVVRLATYLSVLEVYLTLVEMAAHRLQSLPRLGPAGEAAASTRGTVLAAFAAAADGGGEMPGEEGQGAAKPLADVVAVLVLRPELRPFLLALVEYTTCGEALAHALDGLAAALQGRESTA